MKRFPGFDPETKSYEPEVHRKHIFGGHVSNYMKELQEKDIELYQKQFSKYVEAGITPDNVNIHALLFILLNT